MIIKLLISSIIGALVVVGAEVLRLRKKISNETERKIIHIAHALVVVAWAFITSYNFIIAAETLFLLVVIGARYFHVMQQLRRIGRQSWGEIFFACAIIMMAVFAPTLWIFTAAMLHLGLADALAALVGRRFTKGIYYVFGQRKTIAGSMAFYLASLIIIFCLTRFTLSGLSAVRPLVALLLPIVATVVENISPYGSDNLTIPLVVFGMLSWL